MMATKSVTSRILRSQQARGVANMTLRATASEGQQHDGYGKLLGSALGLLGLTAAIAASPTDASECCGIVGVVSDREPSKEFLLEGLTILQNRGYDSAGIATLEPATKDGEASPGLVVTKYASKGSTADSIRLLTDKAHLHSGNTIGIAHTRWATHGGKTDENSHPHLDMRNKVSVVHNGTITNYNELKQELQGKGVTFRSQTDTEVIAQLVGHLMETEKMTCLQAVKATVDRLQGTWGCCVMCVDDPEQIIVARNGSPLVCGYGDGRTFIASETAAFNRYTKTFVALKDGEVAIVTSKGVEMALDEAEGGVQRYPSNRVMKAPEQKVLLSPSPYKHWTIREIHEQPKAIAASLGYGGRVSEDRVYLGGLQNNVTKLLSIKNLLISACGTSLNAGIYGAKIMRELGSFDNVMTQDAAEVTNVSFPKSNGGVAVLSQSGETKDVHRALCLGIDDHQLPAFSVVNGVGSLIARTTNCGVYCHAGRENAVASTKAFVTQVTVMGLVACWFAQNRPDANKTKMQALIDALHRLPITAGMALRSRAKCQEVAQGLNKSEHCFVLGKGYAESVAYEGALKIKEITYLHAEGYSGGALKHGPFALIEDSKGNFGATPIIMIILDDEHATHMLTCAEEVRARGAYTIVITDMPDKCEKLADELIPIPSNGPMTALLATIPLQLIAYELAILRGINPDVPRNLAKAVTVD